MVARCAWNFGPTMPNTRTVGALVDAIVRAWGSGSWEQPPDDGGGHEATLLRLAIDKAQMQLEWSPRWTFEEAIGRTVEWYASFYRGADTAACCLAQIAQYSANREVNPAAAL
jgi:CDP-glucose 4,6-dehydratase